MLKKAVTLINNVPKILKRTSFVMKNGEVESFTVDLSDDGGKLNHKIEYKPNGNCSYFINDEVVMSVSVKFILSLLEKYAEDMQQEEQIECSSD